MKVWVTLPRGPGATFKRVIVGEPSPKSTTTVELPALMAESANEPRLTVATLPAVVACALTGVVTTTWSSNAPMSTVLFTTRVKPRWSVVTGRPVDGSVGTRVLKPLSMAGLPGKRAMVGVGPPLSASGPSLGSKPTRLPSMLLVSAAAGRRVVDQVALLPETLPGYHRRPNCHSATMVLFIVTLRLGDAATVDGRVAGDRAVGQRQRRAEIAVDSAARRVGRVAGDRAVE